MLLPGQVEQSGVGPIHGSGVGVGVAEGMGGHAELLDTENNYCIRFSSMPKLCQHTNVYEHVLHNSFGIRYFTSKYSCGRCGTIPPVQAY